MAAVRVIFNTDRTITVRVGKAVEHVGTDDKTKGEVFDAVKYAVISKGGLISDVSLTEILQERMRMYA